MSTDATLVERLLTHAATCVSDTDIYGMEDALEHGTLLAATAASRIAALEQALAAKDARIAELKAGLRPFSNWGQAVHEREPDYWVIASDDPESARISDLRRAASLIQGGGDG